MFWLRRTTVVVIGLGITLAGGGAITNSGALYSTLVCFSTFALVLYFSNAAKARPLRPVQYNTKTNVVMALPLSTRYVVGLFCYL
jgi:hypothetical protein